MLLPLSVSSPPSAPTPPEGERPAGRRRHRASAGVAALLTVAGGSLAGVAGTVEAVATAGSAAAAPAPAPAGAGWIVAQAAAPGGTGSWSAYANGAVVPAGGAPFKGDLNGAPLGAPIVGMAGTPDGGGYWLVASDGGVFSFGDARYLGSMGGTHLNQPIVGMAGTPGGGGYWLVASDGGVFSFGDARFSGSTGNVPLNQPVVGLAATPGGGGYWLVASDGGVFSFGDAPFSGSTGNVRLSQPVVGLTGSPDGHGYWMVAGDGGVFSFGDAPFRGAATGALDGAAATGIATTGAGYWVLDTQGVARSYGGPAAPAAAVRKAPPPGTDPAASRAPSSAFSQSCFAGGNPGACDSAALADINAARADEALPAISLPPNYGALNVPQQLTALANAERTSRRLPAFPEAPGLDAAAQSAANQGLDPTGPGGTTWISNIASGYATALAADYGWMYDDGVNSPNSACGANGSPGCWGHRHGILSAWAGQAGAGAAPAGGTLNLTQLFVRN